MFLVKNKHGNIVKFLGFYLYENDNFLIFPWKVFPEGSPPTALWHILAKAWRNNLLKIDYLLTIMLSNIKRNIIFLNLLLILLLFINW